MTTERRWNGEKRAEGNRPVLLLGDKQHEQQITAPVFHNFH